MNNDRREKTLRTLEGGVLIIAIADQLIEIVKRVLSQHLRKEKTKLYMAMCFLHSLGDLPVCFLKALENVKESP